MALRPGKVCLRARTVAQWERVLAEEPHALAGDPQGAAVAALPPRRRSERGPLLERLQAMSGDLDPAPAAPIRPTTGGAHVPRDPARDDELGKVLAQVAHAAVLAAPARTRLGRGRLPGARARARGAAFDALCARPAARRAATSSTRA